MRLIIKSRKIELTVKLENFIREKFNSLERILSLCHNKDQWEEIKPSCEVFFEIEKETNHHKKGPIFKSVAYVRVPGRTIEAEEIGETAEESIDKTKDEFLLEIKKYKSKKIEASRRRQRKIKEITIKG